MMDQKSKHHTEEDNWFVCPVCERVRLRGVDIRIKRGPGKGFSIKTCQREECVKEAELSHFKRGDIYD